MWSLKLWNGFLNTTTFRQSRNPFHNFNDHMLWLDGWTDVWRLLRDPGVIASGWAGTCSTIPCGRCPGG